MEGDVSRSSKNTFDYVYNSDGAEENFDVYYNTIDNRADFFGASDQYEQNIGLGARWFGGAEFVSRAPLTGLGADGNGSWISFGVGGVITGTEVYDWRSEAGKTLMNAGFDNFKSLYNQEVSDPIAWDINQLKNEQRALQSVHKKYLGERTSFTGLSKFMTNTEVNPLFNETELSIDTKQGMPGGVDILNYKSRIEFGCKLMVYSASQGCQP
ncbi:hemagglutinin [Salinimonas marina]|uniref:Hemagglutinin n=1 Tax=Salinimonas marina TaxID=2785918 RepID=A0A7S9E0C2_9ALTE|nr:hemagglutinin [Salinimonas marina]